MSATSPTSYAEAAALEYAANAAKYAARDEEKWLRPSGIALALERLCKEARPRRVLELGVGTGRYFPFLCGHEYVGIDVSDEMLAHAQSRRGLLRNQGFSNITLDKVEINEFLKASVGGVPYDLIFSIGCVGYHLPIDGALMGAVRGLMSRRSLFFLHATQRSWKWRRKKIVQRWKDRLRGRPNNYDFFVGTSVRKLRRAARAGSLVPVWIREDDAHFSGKPMILSVFRSIGD